MTLTQTYPILGLLNNKDYLTFTADTDSASILLMISGSKKDPYQVNLWYNLNNEGWLPYQKPLETKFLKIQLKTAGSFVKFKGSSKYFSKSSDGYYQFRMTGKIKASGNLMSLINFADEIPATYTFGNLFASCPSLLTPPKLPCKKLKSKAYISLFKNCTNLTIAPKLPAETLAAGCYKYMFQECTSLINAPELPATKLQTSCYENMFAGCIALVNAPKLPATTLANNCYKNMFLNCTSLSSIEVNFTDWNTSVQATNYWVSNVNSTGTFTCPASLPQIRGVSNIPNGWTINNI